MAGVLNNIKFANTVVNSGPLAAVDPRRGSSTTCSGNYTSVPGTIQAEAFCSMSGIQTENTTDTGGGQNIGYTDTGDWLGYRINVPSAGTYTVEYRVASASAGGSIRLEAFGGGTAYGTIGVPVTGGWQTWQTISHTVTLPAGSQEIGISITAGGFNLNWFRISGNTSTVPIGQTIWLRGINNQYVSGENGTTAMNCNRTSPGTWEQFTVVDAGGGKIALRSMSKYVSSENGAAAITCSRTTIGDWEKFDWVTNADGKVSFRGNNGRYISSGNGTTAMTCNRTTISGWEAFTYGTGAGARTAATQEEISTNTLEEDGLDIYPNPSPGTFTIKVSKPSSISIVNTAGKVIQKSEVQDELPVGKLPAGIYIVRMKNNKREVSKKIVVE